MGPSDPGSAVPDGPFRCEGTVVSFQRDCPGGLRVQLQTPLPQQGEPGLLEPAPSSTTLLQPTGHG